MPMRSGPLQEELLTPTGAALLATSACFVDSFPLHDVVSVGYASVTKHLPIPNVLRLF